MFEHFNDNLFVYYSSGYASNCYLLIGKKIALIDSGLASEQNDIELFLKSAGLTFEDVDIVLHTHAHADHFGNSHVFKKASKQMFEFDAKYVNLKDEIFTCSSLLDSNSFPKIDSFFQDGQVIDLKPFSLKVILTSGHTKGSVCFFEEKQKWLFSGDTLFADNCGRFDLPSGNKSELIGSLKKLKELNFEVLFPGHGLVSKKFDKNIIQSLISSL